MARFFFETYGAHVGRPRIWFVATNVALRTHCPHHGQSRPWTPLVCGHGPLNVLLQNVKHDARYFIVSCLALWLWCVGIAPSWRGFEQRWHTDGWRSTVVFFLLGGDRSHWTSVLVQKERREIIIMDLVIFVPKKIKKLIVKIFKIKHEAHQHALDQMYLGSVHRHTGRAKKTATIVLNILF